MTPIEKACEAAGGQVRLAEKLNVTPQAVNQWVSRGTVPLERVKDIVVAVGGSVSAHELAPALFPEGFEFPEVRAA